MAKRIYVGNLSYQTTEGDLSNLFEQVGQVESVNIITDRDTGRSKGFGFVEMGNEEADKAIAQFNGTELNGRSISDVHSEPHVVFKSAMKTRTFRPTTEKNILLSELSRNLESVCKRLRRRAPADYQRRTRPVSTWMKSDAG